MATLPELTLDAGFPLPATRLSASTAPELALDGRLPLPAAGVSTLGTGGLNHEQPPQAQKMKPGYPEMKPVYADMPFSSSVVRIGPTAGALGPIGPRKFP